MTRQILWLPSSETNRLPSRATVTPTQGVGDDGGRAGEVYRDGDSVRAVRAWRAGEITTKVTTFTTITKTIRGFVTIVFVVAVVVTTAYRSIDSPVTTSSTRRFC
jgi:hypothetical protein